MPDFVFWDRVVIPLAGMGIGLIITLSIVKVIARFLERRHEARLGATDGSADAEGLRAEVQQLRTQVESLEERVDFAERMLAQQRDRPKIGGA